MSFVRDIYMNIKQAVILTGGRGERLKTYTTKLNKGMVHINGKPFLHYLVNQFKANGINKILFLTGYLSETIEEYFGNGSNFGIEISYNFQAIEINHGKRIELASDQLDDLFLLHKCDIFWPFQMAEHIRTYNQFNRPVLMTVYRNKNRDGIYGPQSNIEVNNGIVKSYVGLCDKEIYSGQDIGYLICQKKALQRNFPDGNFSLHDGGLLAILAEKGELSALVTDVKATTITDEKWLKKSIKFLSNYSEFLT